MMKNEKEVTPELGAREQLQSNFNQHTGEKNNSICTNCWIKHRPYDCGHEECPGYKLIVEDVKKRTDQEMPAQNQFTVEVYIDKEIMKNKITRINKLVKELNEEITSLPMVIKTNHQNS